METLDLARRYIDAWNARDAAAIVATFADGGTYEDPTTRGPISGDAIAAMATTLWTAFPDLRFETVRLAEAGDGVVLLEWRMRGTNTGSFHALPPTGRSVDVPGVDVLVSPSGRRIASLRGYFDGRALPEQLGLDVVVQPSAIGPMRMGTSVAMQSGKTVKPGAFSITQIVNGPEGIPRTRDLTRAVILEMAKMDGFIGVVGARIGVRGVTITAWDGPEHPKQLMARGAHREAMRAFFEEIGGSAYTSVWVPARINATWVTCGACKKTTEHEKSAGVCPCGAPLPAPPPYW